ncbi:MAG: hypothetical protein ACYTF1_01330 [Planctomycetota bacterium]|jgi:23S rRNA maturation-related 3'-5' exoribonuclease YhaM
MAKSSTNKSRRYVNQLTAGELVEDQVFLIGSKDLRTTSNGSLYIHCILCDKTGQLLGRMWQATEAIYENMPEGGFLRFKGRVENYKGSLQFIVDAMRPVKGNPPQNQESALIGSRQTIYYRQNFDGKIL